MGVSFSAVDPSILEILFPWFPWYHTLLDFCLLFVLLFKKKKTSLCIPFPLPSLYFESIYWVNSVYMCLRKVFKKSKSLLHFCRSVAQTLGDPLDHSPPGPSVYEILQERILELGCHLLLHRSFPTQGLSPGLPYCRQALYCLSHQGSHQGSLRGRGLY